MAAGDLVETAYDIFELFAIRSEEAVALNTHCQRGLSKVLEDYDTGDQTPGSERLFVTPSRPPSNA